MSVKTTAHKKQTRNGIFQSISQIQMLTNLFNCHLILSFALFFFLLLFFFSHRIVFVTDVVNLLRLYGYLVNVLGIDTLLRMNVSYLCVIIFMCYSLVCIFFPLIAINFLLTPFEWQLFNAKHMAIFTHANQLILLVAIATATAAVAIDQCDTRKF